MDIVLIGKQLINRRAEEIVDDIYRTMVANAPVYTGEVKRSIRVQKISDTHWVVAPHTDHDYWAEFGNHANNPDGRIHPVHAKALAFTTKNGNRVVTGSVRPHSGSRFVNKTANKYR